MTPWALKFAPVVEIRVLAVLPPTAVGGPPKQRGLWLGGLTWNFTSSPQEPEDGGGETWGLPKGVGDF